MTNPDQRPMEERIAAIEATVERLKCEALYTSGQLSALHHAVVAAFLASKAEDSLNTFYGLLNAALNVGSNPQGHVFNPDFIEGYIECGEDVLAYLDLWAPRDGKRDIIAEIANRIAVRHRGGSG